MKTPIAKKKKRMIMYFTFSIILYLFTYSVVVPLILLIAFTFDILTAKSSVMKMLEQKGLPTDTLLYNYGLQIKNEDQLSQFAIFFDNRKNARRLLEDYYNEAKSYRRALRNLADVYPELSAFSTVASLNNKETAEKRTTKTAEKRTTKTVEQNTTQVEFLKQAGEVLNASNEANKKANDNSSLAKFEAEVAAAINNEPTEAINNDVPTAEFVEINGPRPVEPTHVPTLDPEPILDEVSTNDLDQVNVNTDLNDVNVNTDLDDVNVNTDLNDVDVNTDLTPEPELAYQPNPTPVYQQPVYQAPKFEPTPLRSATYDQNEQMKRNSERLKQQQEDMKKRLEAQKVRK